MGSISATIVTRGDTFVATYEHGGSLAGVTFEGVAVGVDQAFTVPFFVIDEPEGSAEFRAPTGAWPAGLYQFQYRQTSGTIITHSYPRLLFAIEDSLFP